MTKSLHLEDLKLFPRLNMMSTCVACNVEHSALTLKEVEVDSTSHVQAGFEDGTGRLRPTALAFVS